MENKNTNPNVAVISYRGCAITISLIKWSAIRRFFLFISRLVGLIKRHSLPTSFIPAYEVAIYDGDSSVVVLKQPDIIFYFSDKLVAIDKFLELKLRVAEGGALGIPIQNFIQNGNPRTQGVLVMKHSKDIYAELSGSH